MFLFLHHLRFIGHDTLVTAGVGCALFEFDVLCLSFNYRMDDKMIESVRNYPCMWKVPKILEEACIWVVSNMLGYACVWKYVKYLTHASLS